MKLIKIKNALVLCPALAAGLLFGSTGFASRSLAQDKVDVPVQNEVTDRVNVGSSTQVQTNETVKDAVAVFGSSEVMGTVENDMATVFGSATMKGKVGHDMVTVFGPAEVDGPVGNDLVVVFGGLKLGPNAKVGHDCVAVFGKIDKDPKAELANQPVEVLPWFSGVTDYVRKGILLGRPLPPSSGLAWIFVVLHLLLYFLVALVLQKPAAVVAKKLETKPLLSFGVGFLILLLLLPICLILMGTVVGMIFIPFILLAEVACMVLGKTAGFQSLGGRWLRLMGTTSEDKPIPSFLLGFILITLLYMVPVVGLLTWLAIRPFALGAVVLSIFEAIAKQGNGGTKPAPGVPVYAEPVAQFTPEQPNLASGAAPQGTASATEPQSSFAVSTPVLSAPKTPPVSVMSRAGFWIRTGATALDFVLLVWLIPVFHALFPFVWLAYFVGMWAWKGTTMGGIVCRLKVVRMDGRPIDFSVAFVRALATLFSAIPLFLGFFWVGWTSERRSWHDLIAGTVIVQVPKGISMV